MEEKNRYRKAKEAKVIVVIKTVVTIGEGTEENPSRYLYQYWSLDGQLLAEKDSFLDN